MALRPEDRCGIDGRKLRLFLRDSGMSVAKLGREAGVSPSCLFGYFKGGPESGRYPKVVSKILEVMCLPWEKALEIGLIVKPAGAGKRD